MIHYQLRCSHDHTFDGWFRDSGSYQKQAAAGLVTCPECGTSSVQLALMAPALARRANARKPKVIDQSGGEADTSPSPSPSPPPSPAPGSMAVLPDQIRAVLQKMRAEVEKRAENVGDRFAEEARAIHRGETPARSIYGDATPDQAEALADEGIDIARIPWVPRADG